jgi:hypothetical protein
VHVEFIESQLPPNVVQLVELREIDVAADELIIPNDETKSSVEKSATTIRDAILRPNIFVSTFDSTANI